MTAFKELPILQIDSKDPMVNDEANQDHISANDSKTRVQEKRSNENELNIDIGIGISSQVLLGLLIYCLKNYET